jgi:hypothetical protein
MSSFTTHKETKWSRLVDLHSGSFASRDGDTRWIFRGDNVKTTRRLPGPSSIRSSIDSAIDLYNEKLRKAHSQRIELDLICEFQRKAHHYLTHVPPAFNTIEWLTLMQHYGAPTRLVDWTYSFYVALFFALARTRTPDRCGIIWAVNAQWIIQQSNQVLCANADILRIKEKRDEDSRYMNQYHNRIWRFLRETPTYLTTLLNSYQLNERLIAQQGTFLMQGSLSTTFGKNLVAMGRYAELKHHLHRIDIRVNKEDRNDILRQLNAMNINSATLFPGLSGAAESLRCQIAYPDKFGIHLV